jgi:DNA end-binding protein Ku
MVALAMQLIKRQTGKYDPADLEDRYETRLRAMIDAKLQGGGLIAETERRPVQYSNVINLVAALKKRLAATSQYEPPAPARKSPAKAAPEKSLKPAAQATARGSAATAVRPPRKRA